MKRVTAAIVIGFLIAITALAACTSTTGKAKRSIVFVYGPESHGYGAHAYGPAFTMLGRMLTEAVPEVECTVIPGDKDISLIETADAIVLGSDEGDLVKALGDRIEPLMKKGVGLACIHYTLDPTDQVAVDRLIAWIGGAFVQYWSVNPFWEAEFQSFPDHPVSRGLMPFKAYDEWYYHMKFVDDMKGVTPILSAVPPESTRRGRDGPHSGNPEVRKRTGMAEVLSWTYERPDGGRGFGFTGMHEHWSWAQDSYRKSVLNGIAWIANIEIPKEGIPSKTPSLEEMQTDLDKPVPADFDAKEIREKISKMNQ